MLRDTISNNSSSLLGSVVTILFILIFLFLVLKVFRPKAKDFYEKKSKLPLEEK